MQAIAPLELKTGRESDRLRGLIETIALRGETKEWREWARKEMIKVEK